MNCKPGDLAVIVKSLTGLEGKIVRCLHLAESRHFDLDGRMVLSDGGLRWVLETPVLNGEGGMLYTYADARLRPLRDSDGEDEVLRMVGRPVGTPQAA